MRNYFFLYEPPTSPRTAGRSLDVDQAAKASALPFTNMRGGLEQEFSSDGKRHRRDHDFSAQSVAAFGAVIKCEFI
jgi:hypothetical protein